MHSKFDVSKSVLSVKSVIYVYIINCSHVKHSLSERDTYFVSLFDRDNV